ncbi:sushi domain-containing protein 2-like [Clupea harengus]|uniref:Sushi domain-containing protein 2-like n=1 Tax=Clupea harengus TaxID=7950 RepID=A0A6P8GE01_CLUHA|nr:sushi domain-containing protein 2-like [Clupea harengus]
MEKILRCGLTAVFLFSYFYGITGQTCEGQCGKKLDTCSCHVTCISLENCCDNFKEFCVDTFPYSGSIFGGTDFVILNATFNQNSSVTCRFNRGIVTEGYVDAESRGHCISPLLYQTGWILLEISTDGTTYNRQGSWLSVHPGKLDPRFKVTLVNSTQWQYYGTPNVGGTLRMTWNTSLVRAENVNLELWGYREEGEAYSESWTAEWKYLYSLVRGYPNNGNFTFVPSVADKPFLDWELGCVRVSPSAYPDGKRDVHAVWSEDHALAWHLEEKFRENSAAWALDKCIQWDQLEKSLPSFLDETIDCPCTLAQARADTGRFHTDYGCDIEKGSVCTYHPGSVHCVRAIQASPKYAAGQQCCYDSTGAQVLTSDSIGGSTPDRGHDWGSPPYRNPPRIPGASHWVYDVLSFYYCCLWSDNCHYYFTHRPSSDCRTYTPPKAGAVFGDPHLITFDGTRYTFNGKGEYSLVVSEAKHFVVQGRTEQLTDPQSGALVSATKLSAVAMREGESDVIEVRLDQLKDSLQVLRKQMPLSFTEQTWMDLKGVFVFSPVPHNVTVMFPSGAGVEVRRREGTMAATVLLPEEFRDTTQGLLGKMNDDPKDDLVSSSGNTVPDASNAEEVYTFGASWAILNESSLFTYDSKYLLDSYLFAPKHDPAFSPAFAIPDNPDDPLLNEASKLCTGGGSKFCRYDTLVARSLSVGNATRVSFNSHATIAEDLSAVVSCGWITSPSNGEKDGTTYLQGFTVKFTCNTGYVLQGPKERTCQSNGQWTGELTQCTAESGAGNNTLGIVLGIVIGAIALATILTVIILHSRKHKRATQKQEEDEAF